MSQVFGVILTLLKVIPAIKDAFEAFMAFYVSRQIEGMRSDIREGIRRAIQEHDQRLLEKAINSPVAGKASGLPDTELRDTLPGVRNP